MAITALKTAEYKEKILDANEGLLLDFWRENCATCSSLSHELALAAEERPELKIYSVSVDSEMELAKKLHVMMAPTLLLMKEGKVLKKSIGFKSKDHILEMVDNYLLSDQA